MSIEYLNFQNLRKLAFTDEENESRLENNDILPNRINIFCGPNGSGKSTVLDIIRTLSTPELLKTLPRENMRTSSKGYFFIRLNNGNTLNAQFSSHGYGCAYADILATWENASMRYAKVIDSTSESPIPLGYSLTLSWLRQHVVRRNTYNLDGLPLSEILVHLNKNARYFPGTAATPLKKNAYSYNNPYAITRESFVSKKCFSLSEHDPESLMVWFNDDSGQPNQVKINDLPAGWKSLSGLLTWLSVQPDNTICIIEEPEVHLHPKLQRILAKQIQEIVQEKSLQLFISTHSTVFLDFKIWQENMANLYVTDGTEVKEFSRPAELLSLMGVRPGDVFHANGIVWVEGPSDRIYIKHWLKLYCLMHNLPMLTENVDYSFILYGGAVMKHLSADKNDMIQTLAVNRNSIFVADKDNDYYVEDSLNPILLKKSCYKEDIRRNIPCWITQEYTIENYLPEKFTKGYFINSCGTLKIKNGKTKVALASIFENEHSIFSDSYNKRLNLPAMIEWIHSHIIRWNCC